MIIYSRQQNKMNQNVIGTCCGDNPGDCPSKIDQECLKLYLQSMGNHYPVVLTLLGQDKFQQLSSRYLTLSNPAFANLEDVEFGFVEFLADDPIAQKIPYIVGIAKLDSLVQTLPKVARKRSLFTKQGIKAFFNQLFKPANKLNVRLSSNVALVRSLNGEVEIWLAYKSSSRTIDLSGVMSTYWMIERTEDGISITPISQNDFLFCRQLKNQISIESLRQRFGMRKIYDLLVPLMESKITRIV